jgi:hypothetical protein
MFSSVSWQEYLISVIFFLIIYYGYILIVYFRKDLKSSRPVSMNTFANEVKDISREDEEHALLFSAVHDLMGELKETFAMAAHHKYQKEGLMMALQANLGKYKKLKGTALQVSVNNHIIRESGLIAVAMDENDIKNMW